MEVDHFDPYAAADLDSSNLLRSEKSPLSSSRRQPSYTQSYLCSLLHCGLVILHVALLVVYPLHLEQRITADLGRQTTILSIVTTTLAQLVGTGYTTILVLVTQQIALKRDFHLRQTYTALHDKANSWLGLGSSLLTLYHQHYVSSAFWSVLLIALYLTGIFTTHITTPSIFQIESFNDTRSTLISTRLGYPDIPRQLEEVIDVMVFSSTTSLNFLTVASTFSSLATIGLSNNTIFDTPATTGKTDGYMLSNTTQVILSCGSLPIQQVDLVADLPDPTHDPSIVDNNPDTNVYYHIELPPPLPAVVTPAILRQGFKAVSLAWGSDDESTLSAILVISTIKLLDFQGYEIPSAAVDTTGFPSTVSNRLHVLACSVDGRNSTTPTSVSTLTGLPTEPIMYVGNAMSAWHDWEVPPRDDEPDWFLSLVGDRIYQDEGPHTGGGCQPGNVTVCNSPNDIELYLYTVLGLLAIDQIPDNATLSMPALQMAMERSIAAAVWYLGQSAPQASGSGGSVDLRSSSETTAQLIFQRSRLSINIIPLIVGLTVSVLLLIISSILVYQRGPYSTDIPLDSAGILQITWLLSRSPKILETFADVDKPDTRQLREAGMFQVEIGRGGDSDPVNTL